MICHKKHDCVNYKIRCFNCQAISDAMHPYPRYVNKKEHERRLLCLLNDNPTLFSDAVKSDEERQRLVTYLVDNGVRVEYLSDSRNTQSL